MIYCFKLAHVFAAVGHIAPNISRPKKSSLMLSFHTGCLNGVFIKPDTTANYVVYYTNIWSVR